MSATTLQRCLFCGGDGSDPDHIWRCDGRQGRREPLELAHFNGPAYEPEHDQARLTGQIQRVFDLMHDGRWRTLDEIASTTGDPPASVSAQLRHLRKRRFGAHVVERQARGDRSHGLWEYRLGNARRHSEQAANSGGRVHSTQPTGDV